MQLAHCESVLGALHSREHLHSGGFAVRAGFNLLYSRLAYKAAVTSVWPTGPDLRTIAAKMATGSCLPLGAWLTR